MSMQICVLSDRRLTFISEWQQAVDAESFPLRLSFGKPLAQIGGFISAHIGKTPTGFECRYRMPGDISAAYPEINFGHAWKYGMAFIWGGDINELQAAWAAAAAYAQATEGIVFDEQEGKLLSPEEAIQTFRDLARTIPDVDAVVRNLMEQIRAKH